MADNLLGRLWADHHDAFSESVSRTREAVRARIGGSSGDPLPVVGRAMALVLAVSLSSLTLSTTAF